MLLDVVSASDGMAVCGLSCSRCSCEACSSALRERAKDLDVGCSRGRRGGARVPGVSGPRTFEEIPITREPESPICPATCAPGDMPCVMHPAARAGAHRCSSGDSRASAAFTPAERLGRQTTPSERLFDVPATALVRSLSGGVRPCDGGGRADVVWVQPSLRDILRVAAGGARDVP